MSDAVRLALGTFTAIRVVSPSKYKPRASYREAAKAVKGLFPGIVL